ncbi:5-dehydro-4-deoxyglucarate dehydratase [Jatrophihabitans cynanchi]|jgi:5-dehydro-4-deoxyglucarate dehydratase|uniref:5-dehydro-4-deoxyglucarate dehydratase n=1 Tax=Jatrophihabitans cynanchi TaxID=2944128 RepID=A0ABY7K5V5_9ACTN|nr:5-dehydro-4-deoxyglucarate dehydratase [Jatrophihabitans sp. SB3-54]WAX59002.1 5-dehydro-4-deoxyglucarate dehydratase [Jatrophihabitans sp. SB3-54]
MRWSYEEMPAALDGLLAFPITPFDGAGALNARALHSHTELLLSYGVSGLFPGCGTGEMGALSPDEYATIISTSVAVAEGAVPVLAGVGFGASLAAEMVQMAEAAGADGALVFPPYLQSPGSDEYLDYYCSLAAKTPLALVIYQRDAAIFTADTVARLAEVPNIVGIKDGTGRVELLQQQVTAVDRSRFGFINGVPTAELLAPALRPYGITAYSSALLNVVPELASEFFHALRTGDTERVDELLRQVVHPFVRLRDREPGYAVSLIKAGARLRGADTGTVRAPLIEPNERDLADLRTWLAGLRLSDVLIPCDRSALGAIAAQGA